MSQVRGATLRVKYIIVDDDMLFHVIIKNIKYVDLFLFDNI